MSAADSIFRHFGAVHRAVAVTDLLIVFNRVSQEVFADQRMIEPFRANILRERPETSATDVTDVRLKQIVLGLINDDSYCFATLERGMGLLVQVDVFGKHLSASGGWKTVRWRTNAN